MILAASRRIAATAVLAAAAGLIGFVPASDAGTWETYNNANALNVVEAGSAGVWAGSDRGLHRYDPATNTFTRFSKQTNGLASNSIRAIGEDAAGNVWFGTADRGVSVLKAAGGWRTLNTFDGLPTNTVTAIEPSAVGTWIGTPSGLALFDAAYQLVALWPDGVNPSPFRSNDVRDVTQLGDSLWIATADGVYATKTDEGLAWVERSSGLAVPNVRAIVAFAGEAWAIAADHVYRGGNLGDWTLAEAGLPAGTANALDARGGDLLVGTSNGVFRWDGAQWVGLGGGGVPARAWVDVDANGNFWAANIEGLWQWNGSVWQRRLSPGPAGNYVHALAVQGSRLYATTRFSGVSRFDGTTWRNFLPEAGASPDTSLLSADFIFSLLVDQDGTKWVGDWGAGLARFDDSSEPPSFSHYYTVAEGAFDERNTFAWSSAQDAQGRRWFGYDTRSLGQITPIGINRIDAAEQRVNFNPQNSLLTGSQIRSIGFAPGGGFEMWVAYAGLGVDVFKDPTLATRFARLTTPELLSMDTWGIQFHGNDAWVATSSGLTRFNRTTLEVEETIGTQPPSSNGSVNPFAVDASGGVWFGTLAGLYHKASDGTVEVFSETNSPLLSNDIHSVVVDPASGDVWIGTIIGINRYSPDGGSTPGPAPVSASRFNVYPNPAFMSSAGITLRTSDFTGSFHGRVFDMKGRVVRHLLGSATTGTLWDAKDDRGIPVRPGLYILEATQGSTVRTGRVFLFR
jgi:ligand-binding sensor domain-containing protein